MVHALLQPRSTYEGTAMWHGLEGPWLWALGQLIQLVGKVAIEYFSRRRLGVWAAEDRRRRKS